MQRIKLAIQKSGRLHAKSTELLKECGIQINNGADKLKVVSGNYPLEILYLRNSDIPAYVKDGVADVGIIGENILIEKDINLDIRKKLGFAKCRLSLAIPKNESAEDLSYFQNRKIATSYPVTLQKYLSQNNIKADIHIISGSVEIAPNIGLADAVCDIVSTGNTLFKNGLKEYGTILDSEAVLAVNQNLCETKKSILNDLEYRIQSVLDARETSYVLMNVPNDKIQSISKLLPVLKSPTVLPLVEEGWSSLHTVIPKRKVWDISKQLKDQGASDILIIPIDKMIL